MRGFSKNIPGVRDECPTEIETTLDKLEDLTAHGAPASEFWELFIQCAECSYVLPRHLYPYSHTCSKRKRTEKEVEEAEEDEEDEDEDNDQWDAWGATQNASPISVPQDIADGSHSASGIEGILALDLEELAALRAGSDDEDDLPEASTILRGLLG